MLRKAMFSELSPLQEKFSLFDLHMHSFFSDGFHSPKRLVKEAVARGISGIAITDHNCDKSFLTAKKEAKKHDCFIIIAGQEISTKNGHIIALGVNESISPYKSWQETIDSIHDKGGIAILAHPGVLGFGEVFSRSEFTLTAYKSQIDSLHQGFDAVEINNPSRLASHNTLNFAETLAQYSCSAKVCSSDSHSAWTIGMGVTLTEHVYSAEDVIEQIKKKNTECFTPIVNQSIFAQSVRLFGLLSGSFRYNILQKKGSCNGSV